jgi:nitroreductase
LSKDAIIHNNISIKNIIEKKDLRLNSTDFKQLLLARRATRCFKPNKVPKDILTSLIDMAVNAGSASNLQSESYIIIENQELQSRLEEMAINILWNKGLKYATDHNIVGKLFASRMPTLLFSNIKRYHRIIKRRKKARQLEGMIFRNAPCLIIIHGFKAEHLSPLNSALAIRNMKLFATSLGLGTCWAGLFITAARLNRRKINAALTIDNDRQIFGALMVGYPKYALSRVIRRHKRDINWL